MKTEFTEYDQQAKDFIRKFALRARFAPGTKKASWEPAGNHYIVRLFSLSSTREVKFDFWGSVNDKENGITPSYYDVLACISGDVNCPETFEDFCAEYGYNEDSRKADQTFRAQFAFSQKLKAFFTSEEQEALAEIR